MTTTDTVASEAAEVGGLPRPNLLGAGINVFRSDGMLNPALLLDRATDQVLLLNVGYFTKEQADYLADVLEFPSSRERWAAARKQSECERADACEAEVR